MLQSVISGKTLQEQLITLPVIFGRLDMTNTAIMQGEGGMILLWTQGWYDILNFVKKIKTHQDVKCLFFMLISNLEPKLKNISISKLYFLIQNTIKYFDNSL